MLGMFLVREPVTATLWLSLWNTFSLPAPDSLSPNPGTLSFITVSPCPLTLSRARPKPLEVGCMLLFKSTEPIALSTFLSLCASGILAPKPMPPSELRVTLPCACLRALVRCCGWQDSSSSGSRSSCSNTGRSSSSNPRRCTCSYARWSCGTCLALAATSTAASINFRANIFLICLLLSWIKVYERRSRMM
ncbi:hypothetical protein HW555_011333 [Spodoptera exigua]|uniref:Uncharacterized protein n=1 Tax=Spodoptera exigua TaxID=7107 RepID=A0A835G776_SPOEX|nr:hypothetical protein HW555_011333 [Spodoptera exigua]